MSFSLIDAIGTAGSLMFAASCTPLAWKTWKAGKALGTPRDTVWMFTGATVLFTTYLALKVGALQGPTLISGSEAVAWLVVLWYEYFPRSVPKHPQQTRDVEDCTREPWHNGPCNGHPRVVCQTNARLKTPILSASDIYKKSSD